MKYLYLGNISGNFWPNQNLFEGLVKKKKHDAFSRKNNQQTSHKGDSNNH